MNHEQKALALLTSLTEAGKMISATNKAKIEAAITALQDILAKADAGQQVGEAERTQAVEEALALAEAEMSHDTKRQAVRAAIKATLGTTDWCWVREMYDTYAVYEVEPRMGDGAKTKLYKRTYVIDDAGKVTLGDPVEVRVETKYVPVSQQTTESGAGDDLTGDMVPLVEKSVRRDGTVPVKIIQPGWGSSGYYSKDVLARDGPTVFTKGLKMYWDHPTPTEEAERPERSLRDLSGELVSDARWEESGPAGPGLYADAKVFAGYKESVEELAPHIGVSIRAAGRAKQGEAEGRKGPLIEQLVAAKSVDFVTAPGAGGQVLQLFEAARGRATEPLMVSAVTMQELKRTRPDLIEGLRAEIKRSVYGEKENIEEAKRVTEQELQQLKESVAAKDQEIARLKEASLLREARDFVSGELADIKDLPDLTRARLTESLARNPVVKEGKLDTEVYKTQVKEAVKAEVEYLAKVMGSGVIRGMGSAADGGGQSAGTANVEEAQKDLEESFRRLGYSESAAKAAAQGR